MNTETLIKYGFYAAAGVAVYFILKRIGVFQSKLERAGNVNIADTFTYKDLLDQKQNATLSEAELRAIAASIKNSWGWLNDDEDKIYNAFGRLGNLNDLKLVMTYYGTYKGEALEDSISNRMSANEVNKVNQILSQKGINFSF